MEQVLNGLTLAWADIDSQIKILEDQRAAIESKIAPIILDAGKTIVTNGVRMRYSNPRKVYNYEVAGKNASPEIIRKHTQQKVDWRKVVEEAGIIFVPSETKGEPKVSFIHE